MNSQSVHSQISRGMTIIEVLASIIVALVGVLGVMILIPFAVRQAQTGLDTEAASTVARNAYHQLELFGYRNPENWLVWNVGTGQPSPLAARYPVSIDPLGIAESSGADYLNKSFPFNVEPTTFPANFRIPAANLRLPPPPSNLAAIIAMQKGDARRMCRAADDLTFGESLNSTGQNDAALNGPAQLFDTLAGSAVKRQAAGRFSWSAIAVPSGSTNWKINFLVYRDRLTDVNATDSAPVNYALSPKMRSSEVSNPTTGAMPVSNVMISAGIPDQAIKKDDWVMLINQGSGNLRIGFFRVISYYSISPTSASLTLDGPDFDFTVAPGDPPTQMVHLKNVVGVYERTIVPEKSSSWNISY